MNFGYTKTQTVTVIYSLFPVRLQHCPAAYQHAYANLCHKADAYS